MGRVNDLLTLSFNDNNQMEIIGVKRNHDGVTVAVWPNGQRFVWVTSKMLSSTNIDLVKVGYDPCHDIYLVERGATWQK